VIVAALILLSLILTITTLFPHVDVTALAAGGGGVLVVTLLAMGMYSLRRSASAAPHAAYSGGPDVPKERWTMPPAALLSRPKWSTPKRAAMLSLGSYMVVALVLLIVKSVQLAGG
jgi:hypothetical protein